METTSTQTLDRNIVTRQQRIVPRLGLYVFGVMAFGVITSAFPAINASALAQSETSAGPATSQTSAQLTTPSPADEVLKAQRARVAAMERASLATVGVFGVDGQGGGSGVCVSADGYVLTNFHVSSPFGHRMRCGLNDGKMYDAVVTGIDPTGDLAVLKMYGRDDFPVASIGDSDQVRIGQWCFAAGNPFVLATNLQPTVTYGLISGVRRYQYPSGTILEYSDCIQTDAAINPGNSGGPLFNMHGDLIGINGRCSFEKRGRVNVGVGYAISIKQAMYFLSHLKSGRVVDHATLGFTAATDNEGRVTVANILETSDAFRRGLRFGDEILRLGDRDIATTNQLKNILGVFPAQWRVPLRFRNEDGVVDTFVRLQSLHLASELDEIIRGESPERPRQPPKSPQDEQPKGDKGEKQPEDEGSKEDTLEALGKWAATKKDPLADRYEARRGFSNYYFNKIELDRILALQKNSSAWKSTDGQWKVVGTVPNENLEVEVGLSDTNIVFRLGDKTETSHPSQGWQPAIKQRSAVGVALALRVWQQWHRRGPRLMGEAIYIGQNPIVGQPTRLDATRITISDIDTMVYTSPETGNIECIEIFADSQSDPVEVFFDRYETANGRVQPTLIRLAYGLETQFAVSISQIETSAAAGGVQQ